MVSADWTLVGGDWCKALGGKRGGADWSAGTVKGALLEVFGAPFLKGQVGGEASCTFLRGHEILGRAFEGGAQESNCAPTLGA